MKLSWMATFPVAASLLLFPSISRAQSGQIASEQPGVVVINDKIDAHKLADGANITLHLLNTVHFGNGTELPRGSRLIATVTKDDSDTTGRTKLALRISSAVTKGGKTIPVKATIIAVSTEMVAVPNNADATEVVMEVPPNLNGQPDSVDQAIDENLKLRSSASSQNSGVLSSDKDDIKLPFGTKMELALAPGA